MDLLEDSLFNFFDGFNCAQAVFAAVGEQHDLDRGTALRIASGFGGGMSRLQKTCGAVTGAIMAIGYLKGYQEPEATEQKEETYALVREFVERFRNLHHSTECIELLGYSLTTEEGRARIRELNLVEKVCERCVKDAATILEELMPGSFV
jgi:C_GCAxxG_C_C family probable redox protein